MSAGRRLRRLAAWGALACAMAAAHAAPRPRGASMNCTPASYAQLVPSPGRIIVPAARGTGAALWGGSLSVGFSCTSSGSGATLGAGSVLGGSSQATLAASGGGADGVSIVSAGTPALSLSSPGCALRSLRESATAWSFAMVSTAAGTCSGTLVAPLELVRAGGALGTDIAASNPLGTGGAAWVSFPTRAVNATSPLGLPAPVPLLSGGGCTVSPTLQTVSLPQVSVSALATPGQTAGATLFRIPLQSCQAITATAYSVYASWSFAAVTGHPSVIRNSAGHGARNVGVQITDAAGVPVTSGAGTDFLAGSVDSAGGVAAQMFVAQYMATGAVSAGAVTATATYTLTYR